MFLADVPSRHTQLLNGGQAAPGVKMVTYLIRLTSSLVRRINILIAQAEADHPGMREAAAMVYVGDVYALREIRSRRHADGWGRTPYR